MSIIYSYQEQRILEQGELDTYINKNYADEYSAANALNQTDALATSFYYRGKIIGKEAFINAFLSDVCGCSVVKDYKELLYEFEATGGEEFAKEMAIELGIKGV